MIVLFLCLLPTFSPSITAQNTGIESGETLTQPKNRTGQVTASVPDREPPTVPVLIAPTDGRMVTTNRPVFIFTGSLDNVGIDHYQFWLDGVVLFNTVATVSQTTATYTLSIVDNQFTLTPLNGLTDGSHTWKVIAEDKEGMTASSATWSFTIDTQAPTFVITTIDTATVSISAQDVLTWPTTPLPVLAVEPTLQGTGEVNSTGVVRISLPGQSDQVKSFTISSGGTWQVQLPALPFDTLMTLTFTVTDAAGNVSVITDLGLIRPSVPVTPLPGLTSYPTPLTPLPTQSPWLPPFPIPSPIEPFLATISHLATSPRILLAKLMPTALTSSLQRSTITLRNPVAIVWNGLGLFWLSLPLLISLVWLGRFLPNALSRHGFKQLLWGIGFWSGREPQGIVFDGQTVLPIAFATVHVWRTTETSLPYLTHRLCNRHGEYLPQTLPAGVFRLSADAGGYLFPAVFQPPIHQSSSTYYLGEEWLINQNQTEPKHLVPLLPTTASPTPHHRHVPPEWLTELAQGKGKAVIPQLLLLLSITWLIPSVVNLLAVGILVGAMGVHVVKRVRHPSPTNLFRRSHQPIQTAVLLVTYPQRTLVRSCRETQLSQSCLDTVQGTTTPWLQVVYLNDMQVAIYEGATAVSSQMVVF